MSSEINNLVQWGMDDLTFQELLVQQEVFKREPVNISEELEEFSLGYRSMHKTARALLDLKDWIVTPKSLVKIVLGSDFVSDCNHLALIWSRRLSQRFPDLKDHLNISGLGYSMSLKADSLDLFAIGIMGLLFQAKNNSVYVSDLITRIPGFNASHAIDRVQAMLPEDTRLALALQKGTWGNKLVLNGLDEPTLASAA